jgi:DNA-binding CsgD family transcriptional regulator
LSLSDVEAIRANGPGKERRQLGIVLGISSSEMGRIRRGERWGTPHSLILKCMTIPKKAYLRVSLSKDSVQRSHRIHRLVAQAFIPNPLNLPEVNHRDGNPANNRVNNLEWATHKGNIGHAVRTGLRHQVKGIQHGMARLTEEDVLLIRAASGPHQDIATRWGISRKYVGQIKSKKSWSHL